MSCKRPIFLVATLMLCSSGFAQAGLEEARETLLQRSPFVPWSPPSAKPAELPQVMPRGNLSNEIVFRGVLSVGGETYYNIFDKVENKNLLLSDADSAGRFKVVSYDAGGSRSIIVQAGNGPQERIEMSTPDGVSMAVQIAKPTAPNLNPTANRPSIQPRSTQPASERRRRVIPRRVSSSSSKEN